MNKQNEDKLQEMDKLYKDNDRYKEELSSIVLKFDIETFERQGKCIEAFVEWAMNAIGLMADARKMVEHHFSCGMCNSLAE